MKFAGKLIWLILIAFVSFFGVIWSLLKSLWTTIPAPEGFELSREDVPQLYEKVEKTCDRHYAEVPYYVLFWDTKKKGWFGGDALN